MRPASQPALTPLDQVDLRGLATDVPAQGTLRQAVAKGVIRIGVACEVYPLLREFGADPNAVIRQAGLDPELFEDENNIIPYAALGRVLTACVAHTHCPHFGLLVGQRGSLSSLGPIGGLMQHSPTVGEALSALVRHLPLHDRGATPTLLAYGDVVALGYAIYEQGVRSPEQITDTVMAVATNVLRTLCGPNWVPDEVLLPRHQPADLGAYRRFFRAPVRFDQETAVLVFPTRCLDHRIADANPIFRQVFEAHVRELEAAAAGGWKESLRRVLRTEILTNRCSATTVADRFAVHRRTLSRHLQAEGAGFQSLVDETRFEIARQLLTQTKIPLSEIAVALGYSEASAFTRAFRRWSGQSPAAWRLEHGRTQPGHPVPQPQERTGRQITKAQARDWI
ncbi:AraC family transcriptional regulator [Microvirga aerophila]|uniref:Putative transcriptional regulatory, AraC family protein n=1 Tax=Microvirga aerophila TaxID=670291 RepID=A0A512BWJ0_9HYPH|nr:AraC family transcriptional regulator [Microvirga aerophila]GEO16319.1 putative transcriptional regulatory, AraC family protein [Microvirga aerophila]